MRLRALSVIAVLAWSNSADSLLSVMDQLDEDVLVVKVDEMVQLMKNNILPQHRHSEEEEDEENPTPHSSSDVGSVSSW